MPLQVAHGHELFCSFLFCPRSTACSSLASVHFAINTPLNDATNSPLVTQSCTVMVEGLGMPHTECQRVISGAQC